MSSDFSYYRNVLKWFTMESINASHLVALIPQKRAIFVAERLNRIAPIAELNTKLRWAAFIATTMQESAYYTATTENLNYTAVQLRKIFGRYFRPGDALRYAGKPEAIANRVYANRMGNGNEASGDGWRFRGRDWGQVTGKDNYRFVSEQIGVDFLNNPDWMAQPEYIGLASAVYWRTRGMNRHADKGQFLLLSSEWNGKNPPHGWDVRLRIYNQMKKVLRVEAAPNAA